MKVGMKLPPFSVERITNSTLAEFAVASGDRNPIHQDRDVARSAGMDDVFAHGMLSMAYVASLLTNWTRQENITSLNVRFLAITPLNAKPTCTGTVTALSDGVATVELLVTLEDGTKTISGTALVRVED